jgi:hypothetical protein
MSADASTGHRLTSPVVRPANEVVHVSSWSERHTFFERLVAMRDGYAASSDDRVAVLSIADVIAYSEAIMSAIELDIEPWLAELDEAYSGERPDGPIHPSRGRRFASDLLSGPPRSSRSLGRQPELDED